MHYVGESWLSRLQRKFGRFAIRNLMYYIVVGMGVVFLADLLVYPTTGFSMSGTLAFDKAMVMRGQVWRLVTFVFLPPNSSLLFILFSLYFYWLIGSGLENQWGSFKFNVFYLCGMLGTLVAGLITGGATNYYLNMSLFLAFAILYPNFELNLFFFFPIKIKWLALLDAAYFVMMLFTVNLPGKIALLVALANIALFFWRDFLRLIQQWNRKRKWKSAFK